MQSLFTRNSPDEIAAHFKARIKLQSNVSPGEVYPGGPGLVTREEERERILQGMTWGFPPRSEEQENGPVKPKAVNNIAGLSSFMWRFVAPKPEDRFWASLRQ